MGFLSEYHKESVHRRPLQEMEPMLTIKQRPVSTNLEPQTDRVSQREERIKFPICPGSLGETRQVRRDPQVADRRTAVIRSERFRLRSGS